jgi:hypothetical protein
VYHMRHENLGSYNVEKSTMGPRWKTIRWVSFILNKWIETSVFFCVFFDFEIMGDQIHVTCSKYIF